LSATTTFVLLHLAWVLLDRHSVMTSSNPPSGTSTPRFTSQAATAEDVLKTQTVGLVNLADFRKRRADVLEQREKEARDGSSGALPSPSANDSDG
jgi:protein FAM50